MPNNLKIGIYSLLLCSILVITSYWFIDKPVVFWLAAHNIRHYVVLDWVTHIPEVFVALLVIIYPLLVARFCYDKFNFHDKALLATANSIAIADLIHDPFKILFGRYWPATWINNNLSLLKDNAYGFNWLHAGKAFASFPSGHTTITVAAMTVIAMIYPRWRWLAIIVSLMVMIGLIGMYYHFVGDVIAGAFLGGLTGFYTVKIMRLTY